MARFREIKTNVDRPDERTQFTEEQTQEMFRRQREQELRDIATRDWQARVEQEMREIAAREGASRDGKDSLAEDVQKRPDTLREEDAFVSKSPEFQKAREEGHARIYKEVERMHREGGMPTRNADPEPEKESVDDKPPTTNQQKEESPKEPGKSDGMPGVNRNPQPPKENIPTANPAQEPNKDGMPTTRVGGDERSRTSTSTRTGMPNTAPDFETVVQKTGGNRSVATDAYGRAAEAATKPVQTITKEQVSEKEGINIVKAGQIGGVEKMGEVMRAAETFSPDKAAVVTGIAGGNLYVAFKNAEELDKLIPEGREVSSFSPYYRVVKFELTERGKEEAAKFVGGINKEYATKKLAIADKESTMDKLLSTAKVAPRGHLVYLQGAEADISAVNPKEVIERARKEHGVDAVLIEKGKNGAYKAYVSEELAADFDGSRHSGTFKSETEVEFDSKADCANFLNEADASDIQIDGPEIDAI